MPFVVQTNNNSLTYVLMTPNLDATGHQWIGTLASFQFKLEYQKDADNGAADTLSRVPISHSWQTVQSLLEGAIVGASDRGEAKANEGLLEEHERLSWEARVQAVKLELMHIVDWEQTQEVDVALATSGFTSGRACHHPGEIPSSGSALERKLRRNRARCSSVFTTVSS